MEIEFKTKYESVKNVDAKCKKIDFSKYLVDNHEVLNRKKKHYSYDEIYNALVLQYISENFGEEDIF